MSYQILRNIVFIISIFITISCNPESNTQIAKKISMDKIGHENYMKIYKSANDSINCWRNNYLKGFIQTRYDNWGLDSLICFNQNKDKFISSILIQSSFFKSAVQDDILYFYGIKIKNKWYFCKGSCVVLPREMYQDDTNLPLSFEKLHEIAMKQIYAGYLKPKGFLGLGGYEINDDFFRDIEIRDAYNYPFTTQESWEESWLRLMRENWAKKDTTIYKSDQ